MLRVTRGGAIRAFRHADLLGHTGTANVVAAALCYRLMGWMFPALSPDGPPEACGLVFRVGFPGPGILDCLDLVTAARTDGRIAVDPDRAPPDAPPAPGGRFHFEADYGPRACAVHPQRSVFPPRFVDQVRRFQDGGGTAAEQAAYRRMKEAFAERLLAAPDEDLFSARVWSTGEGVAADAPHHRTGRAS